LGNFPELFQKEIIAHANRVMDRAREAGMPVIHVEVQRGERTPETALHRSVVIKPGEPVLTKNRVGPFSSTNLDEMLKQRGIRTLVLMGVRTSGCVLSAVRWAADIDYDQIVLSDCCADSESDVHSILMEKVFPRQVTVMTSEDFIKLL